MDLYTRMQTRNSGLVRMRTNSVTAEYYNTTEALHLTANTLRLDVMHLH